MTAFWNAIPDSALWEPTDYRESSWTGHVPFAFYLVDALRPTRLVELGTWYGMSYLAFCQAVNTLGVPCALAAVDTWQGDHQTGPIAENALKSLREAHDPKYSAFSTLMRTTFDEAAATFKDGSIDLLHIDGLHTYDAVRHDFETWLPKLSDRAVVLFHDTQVRHQDFGVYKFWAEITQRYPSFEFEHEHGLGVLGVGKNVPEAVSALFQASGNPQEAARIRTVFRRLGLALRLEPTQAELDRHVHRVHDLSRYPEVRAALKVRRLVGANA